jgi:hypothetical protein
MRAFICSALFALGLVAPGLLWAQTSDEPTDEPTDGPERPQPSPELQTQPEGSYLNLQDSWPTSQTERETPFVDRRQEFDSLAGQAILWPTAHTAEAGTFTYTNFFLLGNTISFAITDDVTVGATVVLKSVGAFHAQATGRIRVHDGPNHIISVVPTFHYQSEGETEILTTSAISTGAGVVSDFYLTDNLVVGAGLHLHLTLSASTSTISGVECVDRDAFFNNGCTDITRDWQSFPSGGHWAALVGHAIYYIDDWINLRAELFTGGVAGTFLGTEYIYGRETLEQRSQRYQDGDLALGIPYDSGVTAGLGTGISASNVSVQLAGYAYYWDDEIRVTPMFLGAITF